MQTNKEIEKIKEQLKTTNSSQKKKMIEKLNNLVGILDDTIKIKTLEEVITLTQIEELQSRSKQIAKMENSKVISNELLINKEIAKLLPSLYQAEYENNSLEKAKFFANVFILLSKNDYKFDNLCIEGLNFCIESHNKKIGSVRNDIELALSFFSYGKNKDVAKKQALYLSLFMIFINGFMPYDFISGILSEDEKVLNLSLNEIINGLKEQ